MRTIFGFRQLEAIKKSLDLIDLYLLEYILYIYAEDKNKIEHQGKLFSEISYTGLMEELPILGLNNKNSVKTRMFNLEKKNLIFRFCLRKKGVHTLIMPNTKEILKIV